MASLSKKEWYKDSLTKRGYFMLKKIKNNTPLLFHRLKTLFKSGLDL